MSYEKQYFINGQKLEADHLNHIEEGIEAVEKSLEGKQPKGNYASVEYIVGVFEELKALIQAGDTSTVIAVLDNAILDMTTLA